MANFMLFQCNKAFATGIKFRLLEQGTKQASEPPSEPNPAVHGV